MKNSVVRNIAGMIRLSITGYNVKRFVNRCIENNIELRNITYISPKVFECTVLKYDLEKIKKIKKGYKVSIINTYGGLKIKRTIRKNKPVLLGIILSYILITLLSNTIFLVEVIHSNSEIRSLLYSELYTNDLRPYTLKKNSRKLEIIEEKILNNNSEILEWIDISVDGTKYIVKVQEKIKNMDIETKTSRHLVSGYNATIKRIIATEGVPVVVKNDYVRKGQLLISGIITQTNETVHYLNASGEVYGDVWFKTTVKFPLQIIDSKKTGAEKKAYFVQIFDFKLYLFNFNKYKDFVGEKQEIIGHWLLPFTIYKEHQYELDVTNITYTPGEAIIEAQQRAHDRISFDLGEDEYITDEKLLNLFVDDSKIILEMYFSVYKNIATDQIITKESIE